MLRARFNTFLTVKRVLDVVSIAVRFKTYIFYLNHGLHAAVAFKKSLELIQSCRRFSLVFGSTNLDALILLEKILVAVSMTKVL